jgi:hypothetical protein
MLAHAFDDAILFRWQLDAVQPELLTASVHALQINKILATDEIMCCIALPLYIRMCEIPSNNIITSAMKCSAVSCIVSCVFHLLESH